MRAITRGSPTMFFRFSSSVLGMMAVVAAVFTLSSPVHAGGVKKDCTTQSQTRECEMLHQRHQGARPECKPNYVRTRILMDQRQEVTIMFYDRAGVMTNYARSVHTAIKNASDELCTGPDYWKTAEIVVVCTPFTHTILRRADILLYYEKRRLPSRWVELRSGRASPGSRPSAPSPFERVPVS